MYLTPGLAISILNTDYKILAKALSNKLQKVISKLVNEDQVGYIKSRYIGQNIRIIEDILTYTHMTETPGYILLVDFEKAFDSIEWEFLFKCLKLYNFGENFLNWIKILYTNIQACVSNNGYFSQYFNLTRVKWLAFTQPQSRILGQDWVLKSVNSVLSPAFGNRFHGSFQICVSRWVFAYKYKGSVDAQFYKAGLR